MRVLNWALDAQKTVGGKIISVIGDLVRRTCLLVLELLLRRQRVR